MLPKNRRLTRLQFWQIKKQGKTITSSEGVLTWCTSNVDISRFAVVASTKLAKRAVDRNRLRRRIYKSITALDGLEKKSIDVIIYPKKVMLNLKDEQISTTLNSLLSKIS